MALTCEFGSRGVHNSVHCSDQRAMNTIQHSAGYMGARTKKNRENSGREKRESKRKLLS